MLRKILVAVLMAPLVALAQSYPSPTFNNLTVQGTFTATGKVGLGSLAAQAANTIVGNATASSATPTAITVTGCNGAAQALQWTNGSGFGCNSAIATSGANSNITALSGLTTALSVGQGGTGATTASAALTNLGAAPIASPTFTGTVTAPTFSGAFTGGSGSFSTLSASSTVSGTGFSNYLASPPAIGGTAANTGKFTTLQATSTITPSSTAGIVGTTTNDSANAGSVGEFICAQVTNGGSPSGCATNSSTPVSLTTSTSANITSVSLTAGDWEVCGEAIVSPSSTITVVSGWISTTSATIPTGASQLLPWFFMANTGFSSAQGIAMPLPCSRVSLASTTSVFLSTQAAFSSTATAYGWIKARRAR
ncbi:hypothetical protein [Paraburkholderia atlantica]|uniref:hypothetical protein n=1 Tax=Paraburkholderia atlantica TaxID=2654982 RepID=UPI00161522E3|nr:hypothetical protein [Paraburkholderia atlantica]MBB5509565.1 hypothetical protein [Paraburkholderia atlantica]